MKESDISEIIEMALSDHISFSNIKLQHNISEKDVKLLMRQTSNQEVTKHGERGLPKWALEESITSNDKT